MRSELVFGPRKQVANRLLLVRLSSKATRILHRPNSRIQDTLSDVFARFSTLTQQHACRILRTSSCSIVLYRMTLICIACFE
jgi:hypothetical protein